MRRGRFRRLADPHWTWRNEATFWAWFAAMLTGSGAMFGLLACWRDEDPESFVAGVAGGLAFVGAIAAVTFAQGGSWRRAAAVALTTGALTWLTITRGYEALSALPFYG